MVNDELQIDWSEWLGLKPGDLVATEPLYLERAGQHYALRYGTRGRPYVEQNSMVRLPYDDPWVLKADENGWMKNTAKLDKLIGLIKSLSFNEDEFLEAELDVSGKSITVVVAEIDVFDYYADMGEVERRGNRPTTKEKLEAWVWSLV